MSPKFCPHCSSSLSDSHDHARGGRCMTCRLLVGARRALDRPGDQALAAGFAANAARREDAAPVDEERVLAALVKVALAVGCKVERMRMTDYDAAAHRDLRLPSVAEILATFETWKGARAAARPLASAPGAAVRRALTA